MFQKWNTVKWCGGVGLLVGQIIIFGKALAGGNKLME
jgi:hypothetical protein